MSIHHPRLPPDAETIEQQHLKTIYKFLLDVNFTEHLDLSEIHLRQVFKPAYPLAIVLLFYGALIFFGLIGNLTVFGVIWRRKLYQKDNIQACVLNLTIAFLTQLVVVIPLSLFVLLVHNWVLGSIVCYTLPIIQDIPTYSLTLTLFVLCLDRHQCIRHPDRQRLPISWALGLVWAVSIGLVLPYAAYITYIDLSILGETLQGGEICIISLSGNASKYIKVLFVLCYVVPMLLIVVLLFRTSFELQRREKAQSTLHREESGETELMFQQQESRRTSQFNRSRDMSGLSTVTTGTTTDSPGESNGRGRNSMNNNEVPRHSVSITTAMVDVSKEKRSQRFLFLIVSIYFVSLLPLNVLKIVRQMVTETYDNEDHFDITYIVIVYVAFVPTLVIPWFFAHWILIGALTPDRVRKYMSQSSFNNGSHFTSSCQDGQGNNGNNSSHHQRRYTQPQVSPPPKMTRTLVEGKGPVVIHEFNERNQHLQQRRVSDHPTPGKLPKRPRATSHADPLLNIDVLNQHPHARRSSRPDVAITNVGGNLSVAKEPHGRRRSYCPGYHGPSPKTSNHMYIKQQSPTHNLTSPPHHRCCPTAGDSLNPNIIQQQQQQQRRHSSYMTGDVSLPPPPPPHQGRRSSRGHAEDMLKDCTAV